MTPEKMKLLTSIQLIRLMAEALATRNLAGELIEVPSSCTWADFHVFTGHRGQSPAYVFNVGRAGEQGTMFKFPMSGFAVTVYDSYDYNARPMPLPRGLKIAYRRLATVLDCRISYDLDDNNEGLCLDQIDTDTWSPMLAMSLAVIAFARLDACELLKGVKPRRLHKFNGGH